MNSGEKLLLTVLERIVPKETIVMLQPDNIRKLVQTIGGKMQSIQDQQNRIEQKQDEILRILNGGRNDSNGVIDGQFRIVDSTGTNG